MTCQSVLGRLGVEAIRSGACWGEWVDTAGATMVSLNPATGQPLGQVDEARTPERQLVLAKARERFVEWRCRPAPARAELVRSLRQRLDERREPLSELIATEMGKVLSEARGEVQVMLDACDLAIGLGRRLEGRTLPSQRAGHRMLEQWHPLGPVGIITSFNFPVAIWAWNAAVAAVCGDVCLWKPSPHTPLCSLAVQQACNEAMAQHDAAGVFNLLVGGASVAEWLAASRRVPLVSFTGSVVAGRQVAARVASRLGRSILELGGNCGAVVLDDADPDAAARAIAFGAVATAGQRCTTTRRLFVQGKVASALCERLVTRYRALTVGDPLQPGTDVGPLCSAAAVEAYQAAVEMARQQGGELLVGGEVLDRQGFFVAPTIVRAPAQQSFPIAWEETFAPLLYLFEVDDLEQAIEEHNAVEQGLASALFTSQLAAAERFISAAGSDCGVANINTGTAGVEVGGAFGGEKDSGSGRELGADAYRAYMRQQTSTIKWG